MDSAQLKAALLASEAGALIGNAVDLGHGYEVTAELVPDHDTSINDFDCYGKTAWHHGKGRPVGFDGSAEKLSRERGCAIWWQPYREGHKVYNSAKDRAIVQRLVEDGFYGLVVTLKGPAAHLMGTVTVELASASVWGLDTDTSDVLAEFAADLLRDLAEQL